MSRYGSLRAGVVGLGHLGRHHARIYSNLAGIELKALCDVVPSTRQNLADSLKEIDFFEHVQDLVDRVDVVSIVTPTSTHLEVARPFLERGRAVLVEKPIASTVKEGREMVELAEARGALLQVGHIEEFNPVLESCRELIQRPRYFESHRLGGFSGRSVDIDVVCDLMIHDLDLLLEWVGSDPQLVHAVGIPVLSGQTDMASVRIEFGNGAVANLTASRVSLKPQRRMRMFMKDRYLKLDFLERSVECVDRKVEPDGGVSIEPREVKVAEDEPLRLELESFVRSAREGEAPRVGGRRALRALELALTIREQTERRVARWNEEG